MAPAATSLSTKTNAHLHTLLAEYTDSTDSLPHDLTRSFGDLRELDAVLRASMQGITQKIYMLLQMMEDPSITAANRLVLLLEIAEDAQRLKMGSEDKIRVAGRTCDDLASHQQHIQVLLGQLGRILPDFESAEYLRRSTYPHVAPSNLVLPSPDHALYQNGRRKRVPTAAGLQYGNASQSGSTAQNRNTGINAPSNAVGINNVDKAVTGKRRRGEQPYEDDPLRKTPKGKEKERQREGSAIVDTNKQERLKPRKSKPNQRSQSPEDKDLSHIPYSNPPSSRHHHYTNGAADHHQYKSSTHDMNTPPHIPNMGGQQYTFDNRHPHHLSATHGHSTSSHPRAVPRSHDYAHSQPLTREHSATSAHVQYPAPQEHYLSNSHDSNGYNPAPSAPTSHPVYNNGHPHPSVPSHSQQPPPYPNGSASMPSAIPDTKRPSKPTGTSSLLDVVASRHNSNTGPDYANLPGRTFEDDDYEVMHPRQGGDGHNGGAGEAGDGDEEERTYCYCDRVSYGDMIACDGDNCEREWFHLSCVGMTLPPQGKWYCDDCKHRVRAGSRKTGRSGRGRITTAS